MNLKEMFDRIVSDKKIRIGFGAAAALLLLWFLFRPKPVISEIGKITKGTYKQIVEEEGITRVKEKFTVYSPVSGILKRIHKHAGAEVKKGETIAVVRWDFDKAVVSPSNGKVLKILRESEGPVEMGTPLLEVGDTEQLEISAEILTQEAVRIHVANPVEIEGWGGGTLNGKVRIVEPSAFTKISSLGVEEQRIRAIVDFDPPAEMGEGFRVRCKITTMIRENALIAPTAALFRDGEDWYVFRVVKNKARKTKVVLEDRSGENALIRDGLKENEEVILYPGEGIGEGVKVR
ncbi:HlyD family efflux transporter periplasmic adaptor subunit [Leptospira gomenensis]|uniref:HlyD family efflux transporter periplasmic adaptor subunit n=2 Tax=Leptospira gomenensis TaxID=2484974 RepID=A0A5F1YBK4_9LEPT|nr:HlyD family efflux transporter periplasmic adaptor subunit [Leptospira gomenensis]TGK33769.1 HlyD family efflux transporter periplasmic adaptor subunit [Leptospira gomenensis]TGK38692.1 HlyD family efflux transporter periplasmic adaptor subunit [Leptospira gomenensis]TGK40590.1 HlyD family efflux transporter periplasmic adaptor subunit [Leptospira gomenensis]TGK65329.1 HlyD family efflux transporter periplasmic adaptor subunit [Leptospira gomenensis]